MNQALKYGLPLLVRSGMALIALLAAAGNAEEPSTAWEEIAPGVLRSAGMPCSYALTDGDAALLLGAARGADPALLAERGVRRVELVLLTHHHRDSLARLPELISAGAKARAPAASAPWLIPEQVRAYWDTALPRPAPAGQEPPLRERTFNEWVYLVLPQGIPTVDCSLKDGDEISWHSWRIACLATPGHSRDHVAYVARRKNAQSDRPIIFCGDAIATSGKIATPYTTDWDHWTGRGLQASFDSLRKLASLDPELICPEHGPPIRDRPAVALYETAMNAAEAAFLKSYERFTKERLGAPPAYSFLARQQVTTAGDEPWSQLTPHLFLTGNTFALASRQGPLMLFDAYGPRIAEQVRGLRDKYQLGPLEAVTISHAHNDHYKGLYLLPNRDQFSVWAQARVAEPLRQPYRFCAPYLDARPLRIDRAWSDGERVTWREYEFVAHHLPGQTDFSQGIEITIDGKKCFFTGDSFYHADHFSGSGGWSGRNRGLPLPYAASARTILQAAPDWILCEHGGAFTFDEEDFRRRVQWAESAARAADALSPSGDHRRDWNPQRLRIEPLRQSAHAGQAIDLALIADAPGAGEGPMELIFGGNAEIPAWRAAIEPQADRPWRHEFKLRIHAQARPGRLILPLAVVTGGGKTVRDESESDLFCVVDIDE